MEEEERRKRLNSAQLSLCSAWFSLCWTEVGREDGGGGSYSPIFFFSYQKSASKLPGSALKACVDGGGGW